MQQYAGKKTTFIGLNKLKFLLSLQQKQSNLWDDLLYKNLCFSFFIRKTIITFAHNIKKTERRVCKTGRFTSRPLLLLTFKKRRYTEKTNLITICCLRSN